MSVKKQGDVPVKYGMGLDSSCLLTSCFSGVPPNESRHRRLSKHTWLKRKKLLGPARSSHQKMMVKDRRDTWWKVVWRRENWICWMGEGCIEVEEGSDFG